MTFAINPAWEFDSAGQRKKPDDLGVQRCGTRLWFEVQGAEASVIAWPRQQTTGYDEMVIAPVKGKRREIRRMLAQRSKELLAQYRRGDALAKDYPLQKSLEIGSAN